MDNDSQVQYITINDYAKTRNITPQAVYQAIKKKPELFEGHIITNAKGTRELDCTAVNLLDELIRLPEKKNELLSYKQSAYIHQLESERDQAKVKLLEELSDEKDTTRGLIMQRLEGMSFDIAKDVQEIVRSELATLQSERERLLQAEIDKLKDNILQLEKECDRLNNELEQERQNSSRLEGQLAKTKGRKLTAAERFSGRTSEE